MPTHVQVCMGDRGSRVPLGYVGVGCSLGHGTSIHPIKGKGLMAVKGPSKFPAAGSTAPLSSMGTVGGQQPHLGFACAPRQLCPEDPPAHSWASSLGTPHAVFCPEQGDSHHCIPLAPVTPPCSLAHRTHTVATALGASWPQNPASVALPWALGLLLCPSQLSQHECSTVGCRSHAQLCRNHQCIQMPEEPALCQSATG